MSMLNAPQEAMGYLTILEEGTDPTGLIVTLISVSAVLASLFVLAFLIWLFSRIMIYSA